MPEVTVPVAAREVQSMIAVADPVPIYRRGLALVLREAGHDVDEWEHPDERLDSDRRRIRRPA